MSLRSLSKHRTEASYANAWKHPSASTRAVKHTQYAINRYHRAVRRSQREVIAAQLDHGREPIPTIGRPYHCDGYGWFDDEVGVWDVNKGCYVLFRSGNAERAAQVVRNFMFR